MASIEVRPNGSTRVKWRHNSAQESVTVDGIRDAHMLVKWLDRNGTRAADDPDLLYAIGRDARRALADPVTVGEALDAMIARPHLAANSRKRYALAKNHLADLTELSVVQLTRGDVEVVMEDLCGRYAEATWRGTGIALQAALRPYGKAGLCKGYAGNAWSRDRDPVVMSKATMDLLAAIGADHGIGDLLAILADTGMRFGEAVAMDREGCDLLGPQSVYRVRWQYPAVARRMGEPWGDHEKLKTPKSRRDIPLSPRMVELAERTPSGLLTVDALIGAGPWRHRAAVSRLAKVSADAIAEGLIARPLHFHDFRHSWGAHLLNNGTDIVTVSRLLGHSSVKITGDIYGHITAQGLDTVRSLLK